ncbi:MAG: 3-methyladenine DNA glycosylase [Vezdaea aestivalis]|nr:MAG: 3-methyladenine DNA glycosylase [Vezdaea aestivalis]
MVLRRSVRTQVVVDKVMSSASSTSSKVQKPVTKARRTKSASTIPPPPSTPKRRAGTKALTTSKAPPLTPTPSAARLMALPYSTGDIDDAAPSANRPAGPHRTNAALVSPETARTVRPTVTNGETNATATTDTLLAQACAHLLAVDPGLKAVVDRHHCRVFSAEGLAEKIDPFRSLTSGIISQQVSGAAATSIKNKFVALFSKDEQPVEFPMPSQVVSYDIPTLRTAGLSQRKAEYIHGLAEKFVSGELSTEMLVNASDEEVLEKLTAVRGLGRWSVEMFACFGLKRMDVFSTGDLGVQRGMAAYMGKDVAKLKAKGGGKWKYMSEKVSKYFKRIVNDMLEGSAKFAPYRSLFMWYMWRIEDVNVDAMQA